MWGRVPMLAAAETGIVASVAKAKRKEQLKRARMALGSSQKVNEERIILKSPLNLAVMAMFIFKRVVPGWVFQR